VERRERIEDSVSKLGYFVASPKAKVPWNAVACGWGIND
jgi:hypothetical protein